VVFVKRATSAIAILGILVLAVAYLSAPVSTVAAIIIGGFFLLLLLPLILVVIGMISVFISDGEDGGWLDGILDAWFMWSILDWLWFALKWPAIAVKWIFTKLRPDSTKYQNRQEEPPFNREA
jgi:hypothetical protein